MTHPVFFLPAMLRPNSIKGMGRFWQQIRVTKLHRILRFEKNWTPLSRNRYPFPRSILSAICPIHLSKNGNYLRCSCEGQSGTGGLSHGGRTISKEIYSITLTICQQKKESKGRG